MLKKINFDNLLYGSLALLLLLSAIFNIEILPVKYISGYFDFLPYIFYIIIFGFLIAVFASQKIIDLWKKILNRIGKISLWYFRVFLRHCFPIWHYPHLLIIKPKAHGTGPHTFLCFGFFFSKALNLKYTKDLICQKYKINN